MEKVADPLRKFCKCPLRKLCQCHDMDNGNPCKKGDICKLRHENSPRCERVAIGLCANRFCKFKHSVEYVFCENQSCQLKHSEPYVLCQSRQSDRQEYKLQKRAQLVIGKVADPLRKFCKCPLRKLCQCHDIDNGNPCKKGDICKLRHENSPRCERVAIVLCANRFCKFKHSLQHVFCTNQGCQLKHSEPYVMCRSRHREQYEPQKPQSLSAQLVTGEGAAPLRKPQKPQSLRAQLVTGEVAAPLRKKFCHFFNNGNSCKREDNCKFRHVNSPRCEHSEQYVFCESQSCQLKHSEPYVLCQFCLLYTSPSPRDS